MSHRYFVDLKTGQCFGEVLAENPANPDKHEIVETLAKLEGDSTKMVYRDGAFHWADDADERLAADARAIRAVRLKNTDWTQLADVSDATRTRWADYRKSLRDITEQAGWPRNIVWPDEPKA